MNTVHKRRVRSFVRRPGRITASQTRALARLLPRFGIDFREQPLNLDAAFGRSAERVLEIGFGDGEALLTAAANYPDADFLGVEVHEPGIGHLLVMLEKAGLTNVRIIQRDIVDVITHMITAPSFDIVNVFFPDPWPKKRHHKRRLIQPPFAAMLARTMKPGALLHIATDWTDYAEQIADVLAAAPDFSKCRDDDLADRPLATRGPTKFERRGQRFGHTVTDFYYSRRR
jgi:tRNA (guanine-N7-)-methyltransferase